MFVVERTKVFLWWLAGFFTVDDHCFGSCADKLSDDADLFFAENPGFKSIDFFSIPRLSRRLNLFFKQISHYHHKFASQKCIVK